MPITSPQKGQVTKQFSIDLSKSAGTYDVCTANSEDVMVDLYSIYCTVAAAGLVSVSIQTNDTVPEVIMTAGEGALASLVAGKNISFAYSRKFLLTSGKKITYTIIGVGTGGTLKFTTLCSSLSGLGNLV
jgi:hypothetical protein